METQAVEMCKRHFFIHEKDMG